MDPQTKKLEIDVEERIKLLPKKITGLVTEGLVKETVSSVAEIYVLDQKQQALLTNEICLILLMFMPRSELAANISDSLGLEVEQAATIAEIVDLEIFSLDPQIDGWLRTYNAGDSFSLTSENENLTTSDLNKVSQKATLKPNTTPLEGSALAQIRTMRLDEERVKGAAAKAADKSTETPVAVPVAATPPVTPAPEQSASTPTAPATITEPEEATHVATSQEETLTKRPKLTDLPSYHN